MLCRLATAADLPVLSKIEQASFNTDQVSKRSLRRFLEAASATVLLAEDHAGTVVGSAIVLYRRGGSTARLYSLAIAPEHRGQGFAGALLREVESCAAMRGRTQMRLEVRRDNATAQALYARHGYDPLALLPGYYEDGGEALRMVKSLGAAPQPNVRQAALPAGWLVLVDDAETVPLVQMHVRTALTHTYVAADPSSRREQPKLVNLSASYMYQGMGYYASLLAEARGHKVIPTVETLLDLETRAGYARALPELEEALNRELARRALDEPRPRHLLLAFGRLEGDMLPSFARLLFDWFRVPLLRISLRTRTTPEASWTSITRLVPRPLHSLSKAHQAFALDSLDRYVRRAWRPPSQRTPLRHAIAVLYDPKEALAPSDLDTLRHWARIAAKEGVEVEPIQRRDLHRLAEFDGLFIRETTSIRNHTYRFARRAWAEGMPVIDDPVSMIRCTNKVYLWDRLSREGLPTPHTMIVRPETPLDAIGDRLGFPVVIKIPDGSYSRGVKKAETMDALRTLLEAFFKETDLLLAQAYMPTTYDWRVGVLDGEPLYVCQYLMAKNHWQIVNHRNDGPAELGGFRTYHVARAPAAVVETAVRASRLIGDGLYGVDIKETRNGVAVIEINDNPDLFHGVEDARAGSDLWLRLTRWFTYRMTG